MSSVHTRPIHILMAEDEENDIEFTRKAFQEAKINNNFSVVRDGDEVFPFLENLENGEVDLILLDLNMPKVSGIEVLEKLKSHPEFKKIPVVILTSSNSDDDILRSYEAHANCYIRKPVGYQEFGEIIKSIEDFWLSIVVFPGA